MANIAIIPARGGSKRIPRKNIKHFLGKPIIAYPITAAIESKVFDEVVVSTDDIEIKTIAESFGAKVLMRSKQNSDDYASLYDVVYEVLMTPQIQSEGYTTVSCILATSAFVTANMLQDAYKMLSSDKRINSVLPVTPYSYPIQRALKVNTENNYLNFYSTENMYSRTQDLIKTYHDAGMFYFTEVKQFLKPENKKLSSGNIAPVVIQELHNQDIDTIEDWQIAEFKYQYLKTL